MRWIKFPIGLKADGVVGVGSESAERMVGLARAVLFWERLWPALWPGLCIVGLFAVLALSGLFTVLPAVLHLIVLCALFALAGFFFWRDLSIFKIPSWTDGARRVEYDSDLSHRPLSEGADTMAAGQGDALSENLWRLHIKRLLSAAKELRVGWPRVSLAARDPYR